MKGAGGKVLQIPGRVITEKAIPKHIMVKLLKKQRQRENLKIGRRREIYYL